MITGYMSPRLILSCVQIVLGVAYLSTMTWAWAEVAAARQLHAASFERIHLQGDVAVELHQLTSGEMGGWSVVGGDDANLHLIHAESADGVLYIDTRAHPDQHSLVLDVGVHQLKEVLVDGDGVIHGRELSSDSLLLEGTGAGSFEFDDLDVGELVAVGAGETHFQISGNARHQFVELAGVGRYDARHLHSNYSQVNLHGSAQVDVWAEELLDIDINGVGDVRYNGSPWIMQQISGTGEVTRLDEVSAYSL